METNKQQDIDKSDKTPYLLATIQLDQINNTEKAQIKPSQGFLF